MARPRRMLDWWRHHINAEVDHPAVVRRVAEDAGWTPRFAFMVIMSAAIAELGLLQSSPAVVIGAMLISPLMGPIMGLGFGLALFATNFVTIALSATIMARLYGFGHYLSSHQSWL